MKQKNNTELLLKEVAHARKETRKLSFHTCLLFQTLVKISYDICSQYLTNCDNAWTKRLIFPSQSTRQFTIKDVILLWKKVKI